MQARTNLRAMEETYSDPNLFPSFQPHTYSTYSAQLRRSKSAAAGTGRQVLAGAHCCCSIEVVHIPRPFTTDPSALQFGTSRPQQSSTESFQEFWDRQQLHLDEQAAKVMHLKEEMYSDLHKPPRMSPSSRRMLAHKHLNASTSTQASISRPVTQHCMLPPHAWLFMAAARGAHYISACDECRMLLGAHRWTACMLAWRAACSPTMIRSCRYEIHWSRLGGM